MTEQVPTPVSPIVAEIVPEKKKFYRNPKIIAGVIAGFVATGAAFVVHGLQKDDDSSDADTTPVETVETIDP